MNNDAPLPCDLARVALAVDAMTVGARWPILIHAESDPTTDPDARPFGLFFTPLEQLESLDEAVFLLERVDSPGRWCLAGLCAPTVLKLATGPVDQFREHSTWFIRVMSASGAGASRLAVPDAPELSGVANDIECDHAINRCLRHLLGMTP